MLQRGQVKLLPPRGNDLKSPFDFIHQMHCQPCSKDAGNEINEKNYENAFHPDKWTRIHIKVKTLVESVTREELCLPATANFAEADF